MRLSKIVVPILIGILIYVVLGSFFIYLGVTIYDKFPTSNFSFSEISPYSITLRNNAVFTFPYVNPAFNGFVNIKDNTGQVNCFVESGKGKLPCETTIIDLGYIPAGQDKSFNVYIKPNNNNFIIQINAYLDFIMKMRANTKTLKCTNQGEDSLGNNLYLCNQI